MDKNNKTKKMLDADDMKSFEQNTAKAIKSLSDNKKTPTTEIIQTGDNGKVYHFSGNGQIYEACKNCIVSQVTQLNQVAVQGVFSGKSIEEYELLLKIKDKEILALTRVNEILENQLKAIESNGLPG